MARPSVASMRNLTKGQFCDRSGRLEELAMDAESVNRLIPSLCKRQKRKCLKCRTPFVSEDFGHRTCGQCTANNMKQSIRCVEVYKDPI